MSSHYSSGTQTATLVIAPIIWRNGWFTARHNGRLLCRSKHPICCGAQVLRDSGYPPGTHLIVKQVGSEITVITTIARAARLTANDMRFGTPGFRRWKVLPGVLLPPVDLVVPPVATAPAAISEFLEAAE